MVIRKRYSAEELKEFEQIINQKLQKEFDELKSLQETLLNANLLNPNLKPDDSAEFEQRETLSRLIERKQKFIEHLKRALIRIKQGTYGICVATGKLIAKERLRIVPHTTHSVIAKKNRL